MRRCFLALLCGLTPLVTACHRGGPRAPAPPVWLPVAADAVIYYDNGGGIQDSLRLVVRDLTTFQDVWEQATSRQAAPPPAPAIDFTREMLLVVAAGRMTPEDQIRVDSVAFHERLTPDGEFEDVLSAIVRTTEGCRRFDAAAYPVQIVRIRRFDGPVVFTERRARAGNCVGTAGTAGARARAARLASRPGEASAVMPAGLRGGVRAGMADARERPGRPGVRRDAAGA